jgi:sugar/nucleoside kinase (ribokinase family)
MRNGILVGGNWIIDLVKIIDVFPGEEKLANILEEYSSNGGSAYNVIKDLARLHVDFSLSAVGLVGEDERGRKILDDCTRLGVNRDQLRITDKAATSYTDVMSVQSMGKRTFFHYRGANAFLDTGDFDFSNNEKIFHLGYLLLLDKLDTIGPNGLTGAATVLKEAKGKGLITTIDLVSENDSRFSTIVPSALPFVDVIFVNEFEAEMLSGVSGLLEGDEVNLEKCYAAAARILKKGVKEWVLLHFPKGAIGLSSAGERIFQPCLDIPSSKIMGAVGAGDAFAAGVLTGMHDNLPMQRSLLYGVCAAASSLFQATSSDGVLPLEECLLLAKEYGFKKEPSLVADLNRKSDMFA